MDHRINKPAAEDSLPPDSYELPRLTRVGSLRELLAGATLSGATLSGITEGRPSAGDFLSLTSIRQRGSFGGE